MPCINVYTVCTTVLQKILLKRQQISLVSQKCVCLKNWTVPTAGNGRMCDKIDRKARKHYVNIFHLVINVYYQVALEHLTLIFQAG